MVKASLFRRRFHGVALCALFSAWGGFLMGCGASTVTPTGVASMNLPRPDRILVYDFAVTPEDVDLTRGLGPMVLREMNSTPQTEEEIQLGRVVANALSEKLVEELQQQGIAADRARDAAPPGPTTASVMGRFERIDQGDQTMRVWVGFGLGASQVRTHVQVYQGAPPYMRLVAEANTVTKSNLKPGMAPMLALGAATGHLAVSGGVGAATTVANEAVLATVQTDAKRTAKDIAQRIVNYYRLRGWIY